MLIFNVNMECRQCQGIETTFNEKAVSKELKKYRKQGPAKTAQLLINFFKNEGVNEMKLLDIGGGVGAIQHELLKEGISSAISVDASSAYLNVAKKEAEYQGHVDRIVYHHGDFINLAPEIPHADVVTLDRVICCYPEMEKLVETSINHAKSYYGIVYPRNTWWVRLGISLINVFERLKRSDFRVFAHSREEIHDVVKEKNFELCMDKKAGVWQVDVFKKNN
ncbi:MAG: class I SAM-dependent methyltransferase [Candidatus Hodarchaeota archaeon]